MFGPVLWLLALSLVVAGFVWMVRRSDVAPHGNVARTALDMRFAKGEIDAEDYAARKKMLAD